MLGGCPVDCLKGDLGEVSSPAVETMVSTCSITRSPPASRSSARRNFCSGSGISANGAQLRSAGFALHQCDVVLPVVAGLTFVAQALFVAGHDAAMA